MKKLYLLMLLLGSLQVLAQSEQQLSKWSVGGSVYGNLLPEKDNLEQLFFKPGVSAGINAGYKFNEHFTLKTGLMFAQKGKMYHKEDTLSLLKSFNGLIGTIVDTGIVNSVAGYINDKVYSHYEGYNRLGYIEIPLLAEFSGSHFKFAAGPYIGLLVNAHTKESLKQDIPALDLIKPVIDSLGFAAALVQGMVQSAFPGYNQPYITETSETADFVQLKYGYMIQLSYKIYPNTFLELRFSQSLNDYLKNDPDHTKIMALSIGVNYSFHLRKKP